MRALLTAAVLAAGACASSPQITISGDPACVLDYGDKAWLARAPDVWRTVSHDIFGLASPDPHVTYVLFDAQCAFTSEDARTWSSVAHGGQVVLPDGQILPAQVTSFAAPAPDGSALTGMRHGKRWSQDEGLALFMVLDRFSPEWPAQVFGAQPKSGLSLLAAALGSS